VHAQTLDDVVRPYLHLPMTVQTAILRVQTHPVFRSITRSMLEVLKSLVSRASATNGLATIMANLEKVAVEVGVSYKTVQRSMRMFSKLGWVHPASEGRSEYGVYCSRRYRFSQELCNLVELPTAAQPAPVKSGQETEMSDGPIYDLTFKKDHQEIAHKARKEKPIQLPEPVKAMPEETGIQPSGICKLLGLARAAGYKLEHVYAVARPYLERGKASAGRAYRYLQTLIGKADVDYAGRAAQIVRQDTPPASATEDECLAQIARACRYKRYVHVRTGMRVRFFDGTAEVYQHGQLGDFDLYSGPQLAGLYRGIANGNLKEVME